MVGSLVEVGQLDAALDGDALAGQVVVEDRLGRGLRQEQQERVRGVVEAHVEQRHLDGAPAGVQLQPHGRVAPLDQRVGQAEAGQHLERAGLDGQRPRLVHPVEQTVDDADAGAAGLAAGRPASARWGRRPPPARPCRGRSPGRPAGRAAGPGSGRRARTNTDQCPSATAW